jgi:hypothetical protein
MSMSHAAAVLLPPCLPFAGSPAVQAAGTCQQQHSPAGITAKQHEGVSLVLCSCDLDLLCSVLAYLLLGRLLAVLILPLLPV